ncbi:MAG: FHA domain-containing protein [Anaerolineae bacterium]|nr:FHA domain-containing protein [Anaerolineae bacterium]
MTREANKRLLIVAGLTLLMAAGVVLPLHAAPSPRPAHPQGAGEVTLEFTTTQQTVTAAQNFTLTATILNSRPISITNVHLTITLPTDAISHTVPLTSHWPSIEPAESVTHLVPLHILDREISRTLRFTATLQYSVTETMVISRSIEVVVMIPESSPPPPPPAPTPLPSYPPSPTPPEPSSPVPTSAETPPAIITPTAKPEPAASPAPAPQFPLLPPDIGSFLVENQLWVEVGCLLMLLLILIFTLILMLARRRRRRPGPPPTPPPPPLPIAPHLESVGTPGGPRRFDLKPGGVTIGRATENGLVITQDFPAWETVSRRHARIYQRGGSWVVEDLGSMNGVYVNRKRTGRNLLRDDWRLSIGEVEFIFRASTGEV